MTSWLNAMELLTKSCQLNLTVDSSIPSMKILDGLRMVLTRTGNDGAHEDTLKKEDAEDVLDFTYVLLERLFTEPERIRIAQKRRAERRSENETETN